MKGAHPSIAGALKWLQEAARAEGIETTITEVYRSPERQAQLYAQGRGAKGEIVTNARPGFSAHQYGLAADIYARNSRLQPRLRQLAKKAGFRLLSWDPPHVEHPAWPRVLADLRRRGVVK